LITLARLPGTPIRWASTAILALLCLGAAPARAQTYPPGFEHRTAIGGLTQTVAVAWAPDGTALIAEKPGRVKVAPPGSASAALLLDISDHVNEHGDRGLEGIAVDSDFQSNGFVYLAYVYESNPLVPDSDAAMTSRVTRIRLDPVSRTLVNPSAPETTVLGSVGDAPCPDPSNDLDCIPADSSSHMVGTVRSAPDGSLWVGSGDGSSFGGVEPRALRALDERSLSGKVLHTDRNGRGLGGHAFCPQDADLAHVCTKVHAKGFRNPFRFHFRPGGGLSVADVGWNTREEIDLVDQAGKSYGWPCYEGTIQTPGYRDLAECAPVYAAGAEVAPDHDYGRDVGGAIIGGPTYTGSSYPAGYRGSLFFGDYTGTSLRRLVFDQEGNITSAQGFATDWIGTDIETGPDGEIWYAYFGTGAPGDGEVRRIVYTPGNASPRALASATPTEGSAPLTVAFRGSDSTDADGDTLSYRWDFGDGSAPSDEANPVHTYDRVGNFTARLTVSDGRGLSGTTTQTIASGGTRPVPTIVAPGDGSLFRTGDPVVLEGAATDAEEGTLPSNALTWRVTLQHADHEHPHTPLAGAQASFVASRDHDADFSYRITLTATDSTGLSASRTIDVVPQTAAVAITSLPSAAPLSYAGREVTAPHSGLGAIGADTTVSAARSFLAAGRPHYFESWSDGGARLHDVRIPAGGLSLQARYLEDKAAGRTGSATASMAARGPEAALDGDLATWWESPAAGQPAWQVDLGRLRTVDRVELDWSDAYAPAYRVLASRDGVAFQQVAADGSALPGPRLTRFGALGARYVRVEVTERLPGMGVQLREARVLGPPDPPPTRPTPPAPVDEPAGGDPPDAYARAVLDTDGLLAYLRLDDRGRGVTDLAGRIGGRLRGRPRRVAGLVPATNGRALALRRRGDRAELSANGLGRPGQASMEAWLRPARARLRAGTIAWWGNAGGRPGLALALDGRGRLRFVVSIRNGRATAPGPVLRPGRVYHLAATFDGARLRLYVNGRLRGFATLRGRIRHRRGRRLLLGARPRPEGRASNHLRGTLDEVAIYAGALAPSTVRAHRRAGR
jgi:glucose/arabinose dehydrogenase